MNRPSVGSLPAHLRRFRVLYALAFGWVLMAVALPSIEPSGPPRASAPPVGRAVGGASGAATGTTENPVVLDDHVPPASATGGSSVPVAPSTTGAPGVARSGVVCVPGARQILDSSYAPPCVPRYEGPTPRSGVRGVSAKTVRVVMRSFPDSEASEVARSVGAGIPEDEVRANEEMFTALFNYLNENFELYGRKVELIRYPSRHGDRDAELVGGGRQGACADAAVIADELKAFGVVELVARVPFERCAAERGLVVFNANSYASGDFYEQHHPYLWAPAPDCERISHQLADYAKARLVGRPAIHAGEVALRAQSRRLGVYVPDLDEYQRCMKVTAARLRSETGAELVLYTYRADASRLAEQASRAVVFFRQQGVTSIILACDSLSPLFLTRSAASIGYSPEWITSGAGGGEDIAANARFYDEAQVNGHLFGRSLKGSDREILGPTSEPGRIYKRATGRTAHANGQGDYYGVLLPMFLLLQAGGPDLSAQSIAAGALALPDADGPVGRFSFGSAPDGSRGHDHTMIDDALEIYWDPTKVDHFGQRGDFVATMGGRRFGPGGWPAGNPTLRPS